MERIKKIEDIILNTGNVLIKLILKDSKIVVVSNMNDKKSTLASTSKDHDVEYGIVVAIGTKVDDIAIGDIILDFNSNIGMEIGDDKYVIGSRLSINVAVKPKNFDPKRKIKKLTP